MNYRELKKKIVSFLKEWRYRAYLCKIFGVRFTDEMYQNFLCGNYARCYYCHNLQSRKGYEKSFEEGHGGCPDCGSRPRFSPGPAPSLRELKEVFHNERQLWEMSDLMKPGEKK